MNDILYNKEDSKEINLCVLNAITKKFNDDYIVLYVGISEENSIFIRAIDKEDKYYEKLFPYTDIAQYFLDILNNIIFIYDYLKKEINGLKYNDDKTKINFFFQILNANTGRQEEKKFSLHLKSNPKDILIIKNIEEINKINQFNKIYASNLSLFDKSILLYKKNINNKGFYELCQLKLNVSIINLDDNKISKKKY